MGDAEDRLNEANRRLSEAQKQLSQAHVVISEIRNETQSAKTNLLKSDANIAKKELTTRFNRAISSFRSKQQIISLVLNRIALQAKETFGSKKRARALINETIQKLLLLMHELYTIFLLNKILCIKLQQIFKI